MNARSLLPALLPALALPALWACGSNKPPAQASADAALPATPAAVTAEVTAAAEPAAAEPAAAEPAAAEPAAAEPATGQPSDEGYAIFRALSVRDPAPDCATVEALSPTPVDTLLEVIQTAQQPPWVGMRAATCLIQGHGDAVAETLTGWVSSDDTRGFALLVLSQLDALPEAVALDVANHALSGPYADDATLRIAKSTHPALQALAQ